MRGRCLVSFEVLVETVLGFLVVRSVVIRFHAFDAVALLQVRVEQRFEEAESAAPIRYHVGHFEVDAAVVVTRPEQHAFRVDVQPVADR